MGSISETVRQVRLAILECDTPRPRARSRYGSYGGMFERIVQTSRIDSVSDAGISVTKWQIDHDRAEYPALENVDAILLTGSKHSAYEDVPWINILVKYTQQAINTKRIKVIGVCFGHQIIGVALNARVGLNPRGWRLAVLPVELSATGRALFKKERLNLQFSHQDVVFDCPAGIQILGSTPACENQGMYVPNRLISLQGHPEFDERTVKEILEVKVSAGQLTQPAFQESVERAGLPQDGLVVGSTFRAFLLEQLD